ncbi:PQQ-binding-like beta-propeller repeat protein [Streptomyces sp. NPDC018036]|uniref:outer membrane protein assembly factor BamB family protein n=1 Tax=Streptomyces sp. NPDC018036 TaxID=3365035 RepID=UPI0037B06CA5
MKIPELPRHGDRSKGLGGTIVVQRMNLLGEPGVGLAGIPGRTEKSRVGWLWNRPWKIYVWLAVFLLVKVTYALDGWYMTWDVFTGAHGPFPAVFAAEAPVAPEHVISLPEGKQVLVHGLSLRWTDEYTDKYNGMAAVNVRTGKEYWHYERHDVDDALVWQFGASERTVVVRFTDGKLVALDLRTGESLWHAEIQAGDRGRNVKLAGGQAVTEDPGAVRAFDERDGRNLWTAKTPKWCHEVFLRSVHILSDHLSAIQVLCNGSGRYGPDDIGLLMGVDNRTGKVLWQQRTVDPDLTSWGGEHTLIAPDPDHRQTTQLLDVNRHGISPRTDLPLDKWDVVAVGNSTVLSGTNPKNRASKHDTLLSAFDVVDGHLSWQLRAPSDHEYGLPEIADGRVYVVRQPYLTAAAAGSQFLADLLVLDADTGRLLHTLRLPTMTADNKTADYEKLVIGDITDGAVGIGWRDDGGDLLIASD